MELSLFSFLENKPAIIRLQETRYGADKRSRYLSLEVEDRVFVILESFSFFFDEP